MKRFLFISGIVSTFILYHPFLVMAQVACDIHIISDFESECLLEDLLEDEMIFLDMPEENCILACQGRTVTYRAECSEQGTFSWNVSGASEYNISNDTRTATITWNTTTNGVIAVSFISEDSSNVCTAELCLLLIEPPTVGSTTVPSYYIDEDGNKVVEVCIGEEVEFFDRSEGFNHTIIGCEWTCSNWPIDGHQNFGFGQYSTNHCTYETLQAGEFKVRHSVINLCGCEDEETIILRVTEPTNLELSCYGTVCANSTAEYSVQEPFCSEYHWMVEGGTIVGGLNTNTVTVNWGSPLCGYGTLSLDAFFCESDCGSLSTVRIPIIRDSVEVSGPETVCVGDILKYGIPRYGSTYYNWQILSTGGLDILEDKHPNNCMLRFNQPGIYEFYAEYGCDFLGCGPYRTITKRVMVKDTLRIYSEHTICVGDTGRFTTNCPESVQWDVYDSSGHHIYNIIEHSLSFPFDEAGDYKIVALNSNYCEHAEFALNVLAAPPALTTTEGPHTACPGHAVLLSATPSRPDFYLEWRPAGTTTFPSVTEGDEATFTFFSASDVNVYQVDGRYGCRSRAYVHTMEQFHLAPFDSDTATGCFGGEMFLSVADQSENVTYKWTVEPQSYASVVNDNRLPSVTLLFNIIDADTAYARVRLRRTFCSNVEIEETKIIRITRGISPSLNVEHNVCQNTTTYLSAIGPTTDSSHYHWLLDDEILAGRTVSHVFDIPGLYPFTLVYDPHNGCLPSEVRDTIDVTFMPDATLSYGSGIGNSQISVPEQADVTYSWTLNGNIVSTAHFVSVGDNFTGSGCCTVTSNLNPNCYAHQCRDFSNDSQSGQGGADDSTSFYHTVFLTVDSSLQNCNAVKLWIDHSARWSIIPHYQGNYYSMTDNADEVSVFFSRPGMYQIKGLYTSRDTNYIYQHNVTVNCIPKLKMCYDCSGQLVIEDKSQYLDGFVPRRTYHIFIDNQPYDQIVNADNIERVALSVNTPMQIRVFVSIDEIPCTFEDSLNIPAVPSINSLDFQHVMCADTPFPFSATVTGDVVKYLWNFGDGSSNYGDSIFHMYAYSSVSRDFVVTLTVSNSLGCSSSRMGTVTVTDNFYEDNDLSFSPNNVVCPGDTVTLTYLSNSALNWLYYWNFDALGTRSNTSLAFQTGNYRVRAVNDQDGCVDEKMQNVKFNNGPTARITGMTQFCMDEEVVLYGNSGSTNSYLWQVPGSGSPPSVMPTLKLSPMQPGTYMAQLTVENRYNCQSVCTYGFEIDTLPAIPPISILPGNYSLMSPPVPVYSVRGDTLNWSNGFRGIQAEFYNDGYITARYVDPSTGCSSGGTIFGTSTQPLVIQPGITKSLEFYYTGGQLNLQEVEFMLWEAIHDCEQRFNLRLDWNTCVSELDCPLDDFSWDFSPGISTPHQTSYFDIHAYLPSWIGRLLGFWCEPFQLSDIFYVAPSEYNALLNIDYGRLSQMVTGGEDICFHIVTCIDGQICASIYCLPAQEVFDRIEVNCRRLSASGQDSEIGSAKPLEKSIILVPNPAKNEVTFSGLKSEDIATIQVMTMEGRIVSSFSDTERFDVGGLVCAPYIVRLQTRNGQIFYLKLIKQ